MATISHKIEVYVEVNGERRIAVIAKHIYHDGAEMGIREQRQYLLSGISLIEARKLAGQWAEKILGERYDVGYVVKEQLSVRPE